ncbi:uncharacterized protein L3040_008270 [Drepanopeziza brunnea f. sp. 'multigermtubi']|uniref:uncharacterized protein n=1 Tax=Drepanopeziza brunnea f. sp. 'multigermtubi' TaxID=698441 RepID=UPI002383036D|nr:hypothetical protein L3040_008270 [Drepanopeziza brunnea f. sp. 'multigermtubi']
MAPQIKSQEAAFRQSRQQRPAAPKTRVPEARNTATGNKVSKNKSRNERRKAARKTAALLKAQGLATGGKKSEEEKETLKQIQICGCLSFSGFERIERRHDGFHN